MKLKPETKHVFRVSAGRNASLEVLEIETVDRPHPDLKADAQTLLDGLSRLQLPRGTLYELGKLIVSAFEGRRSNTEESLRQIERKIDGLATDLNFLITESDCVDPEKRP